MFFFSEAVHLNVLVVKQDVLLLRRGKNPFALSNLSHGVLEEMKSISTHQRIPDVPGPGVGEYWKISEQGTAYWTCIKHVPMFPDYLFYLVAQRCGGGTTYHGMILFFRFSLSLESEYGLNSFSGGPGPVPFLFNPCPRSARTVCLTESRHPHPPCISSSPSGTDCVEWYRG